MEREREDVVMGFDWLVASVVMTCAKCSEWAMAVLAGSGDKDEGDRGKRGGGRERAPGCVSSGLAAPPIWPM